MRERTNEIGRAAAAGRTWAVVALALVVAVVACADVSASESEDDGTPVTVYLVGSPRGNKAFQARVLAAFAVDDEGAEVPLEVVLETIDRGLARQQQLLATGTLPPALYRGVRLLLAPPAKKRAESVEASYEVRVPADFRTEPGKDVTLNVHVDRTFAPGEGGALPEEAFVLVLGDANVVRRLTLYVTDEAGGRVVAVNRNTDRVFAAIEVGARPRGIAVPRRGRRVYVANSGDDTVSVIDVATHQVEDTLNLKSGCAPEAVAVTSDGRRLAVACPGRNLIAVIDPLRNAQVGEIELGRAPSRMAIGDDSTTLYALVPESSQLISADLLRPGLSAPRVIGVQAGPTEVIADALSGVIYVTHAGAPVITVAEVGLMSVRRLQTSTLTYGLALDRNARRLYVTGGDAGGLSMIGAEAGTLIRRWAIPQGYRIALDPDTRKIFVTGGPSGQLMVVDRISGKLMGRIPVGGDAVDLVVVP